MIIINTLSNLGLPDKYGPPDKSEVYINNNNKIISLIMSKTCSIWEKPSQGQKWNIRKFSRNVFHMLFGHS